MHDLHEANKILKVILDYARLNKLSKVSKAVIALGSVVEHGQEISPENLHFNLQILAKNTLAKNLQIIIRKTNADSWILEEITGE